jgi:protein SCO1/2
MRRAIASLALAASLLPLPVRAAPPDSPWGEQFWPNIELVTQDGKKVRFYDDLVRDRHVVVSFIFTHCTKQCGLMTANLARVQRALGGRVGKDLTFYSITMDPERDDPAALKRYAAAFKAGPGWTFLTGAEEDIERLRKRFGDLAPRDDHSTHVYVGNDRIGQWLSTSALDNPQYLAGVVGDWLDPAWATRQRPNDYAQAPDLPRPTQGEVVFTGKCQACHLPDGQSVGPDLAGVTRRRDRRWIERWIRDPGKLVAEGDPTALALLAKHHDVLMPPVELSEGELTELLSYLESSAAVATRRP